MKTQIIAKGWGQACDIGISNSLRLNSTILRPNSTSFWNRICKCLAAELKIEMFCLKKKFPGMHCHTRAHDKPPLNNEVVPYVP